MYGDRKLVCLRFSSISWKGVPSTKENRICGSVNYVYALVLFSTPFHRKDWCYYNDSARMAIAMTTTGILLPNWLWYWKLPSWLAEFAVIGTLKWGHVWLCFNPFKTTLFCHNTHFPLTPARAYSGLVFSGLKPHAQESCVIHAVVRFLRETLQIEAGGKR